MLRIFQEYGMDIYRSVVVTAMDSTHLGHLEVFGPERLDNILIGFDLGRHRGPYTVQNAFERELLHVVAVAYSSHVV